MPRPDIAFLVYEPLRQRRADNSFDGNDNVGALVVADVLQRSGHAVSFCSPETAKDYRVVLVSFTSTYDLIAYYQAVALLPSWQPGKRSFVVVGGGFGMQNPTAIRHYVDYAVFGRAEGFVSDMTTAILGGVTPEHPSIMHLPELHPVKVAQAAELYPHAICNSGRTWTETFTGCPRKCRFCHYTWARRSTKQDFTYHQDGLTKGARPEITWDKLLVYPQKAGRVRSALDGFSERLRHAYGKRISNRDIISGIEHLGSFGGKATVILAYNISNMPGETEDDRQELYTTLRAARPETRVILVLQSTPFRPSLLTPMQHCAVSLYPATSSLRATVIEDTPLLRAMHSFSNESPYSQLQTVIIERATPDSDKLFHALCFSPKLRNGTSKEKIKLIESNFNLNPYLRRYDLDEKHPAWFLTGYMSNEIIRKTAEWMERQIHYGPTP